MKLPRCVTCHPAPVKTPPDTSPTDVRFVRGSKIVALPAGEGVVVVEVGGGGGGVGVDVPPAIPTLPGASDALDVPVKGIGVDGSSRLQLAKSAVAAKIAAGRQNRMHVASIGVVKVGFCLPHRVHARHGERSSQAQGSVRIHIETVYVMRKNNDSTSPANGSGETALFAGTRMSAPCPTL